MEPRARPIDVNQKIVELIDSGAGLAVATVLSTQGSAPQWAGAKAVTDAAGCLWGTVGGGAVEAETQRIAIEACRSRLPVVFEFHLDNDKAAEAGAICGGMMRILVDPTVARHRSCFAAAVEVQIGASAAFFSRRSGKVFRPGRKRRWKSSGCRRTRSRVGRVFQRPD